MRVLIKKSLNLTNIREGYIDEFREFLQKHGFPYRYASFDKHPETGEQLYIVYLNPDNDPTACVNLSYEDMKIFLNTVERHSSKRIQFEYLGNMRFDLILGN